MSRSIEAINTSQINDTQIVLITCVFYFFNSVGLPGGFTYTLLLTPVFLFSLDKIGYNPLRIIIPSILIFLLLICIHSLFDISLKDYVISSILYMCNAVFLIFSYRYFSLKSYDLGHLISKIVLVNAGFVLVAILSLVVWQGKNNVFWYTNEITEILNGLPRLKLLTSEASVYSLLLAPVFLFYFQYAYFSNLSWKRILLFGSIIGSLILSLSYGVIGGLFLSILISLIITQFKRRNLEYNSPAMWRLLLISVVLIGLVFIFFNDSGLILRFWRILEGNDTSFKGRSSDSFFLADKVLEKKSEWFGIGPGQLKIFGKSIFDDFYAYSDDISSDKSITVRLPNAVADTYVTLGIIGVIIRFVAQFYIFFKFKISNNFYKLCLFNFLFIYQFFGSNITDLNYYFGFIILCLDIFPDEYFMRDKLITDEYD